MSRREKRTQKKSMKRIVITVALLIVAIIIIVIANKIKNSGNENKIGLVINNNVVTERVKNDLFIQNDVIYLSESDVSNYFDKYLYLDNENKQIITTSEKKMAYISTEKNEMTVNGTKEEIYETVVNKDGEFYLPISEMNKVYDIELEYNKTSNTVIIDSLDRQKIKACASKNTSIKNKPKMFSSTVAKVEKGDWLVVAEKQDNGWAKVRTEEGQVGYIKTKKLTNEITVRNNMEEEKQIEGKINLVWDYFSEYGSAPDRSGTKIEGVNVVSPAFFYIDENGNFQENVGSEGKKYIIWAKENKYKIWPMVSNAGSGMLEVTSNIMNDFNKRQKLIENIVNVCVKYNLDGINIDFENMKQEDKDMYSQFIIELTPRIKEIGLVTSVDVTAPDGAETWSLCFDRHVIGDVADYIMFMAYDQYGVSSKKAGTTAGYNWVETNINKFINTEEIDTDKIILGIPLYTRLWTIEDEDNADSSVVNMNKVDEVVPKDAKRTWDNVLKQNIVEYTENGEKKKMWIEDLQSIQEKVSLVTKYNLGGVASWEKDREIEDVWTIIKNELQK